MFLTGFPPGSEPHRDLALDLVVGRAGDDDAAGVRQLLQPLGDDDAVAVDVVALDDHVAQRVWPTIS